MEGGRRVEWVKGGKGQSLASLIPCHPAWTLLARPHSPFSVARALPTSSLLYFRTSFTL
ncbi:hypothetical protein E2C01_099866 [Portunus trituberculatus]|uniref:Uncharacterized protein n=1 Tax=Portunus trituberculatus TaxID=210409 RepID=A0A5B7K1G2_PORTR|nr:hypothetical protein [Portunus trituberculatus]